MNPVLMVLLDTVNYWRAFVFYLRGGGVDGGGHFAGYDERRRARCHVFSMALAMRMWGAPHYRKASYAGDVADNFRNVAVPGTGIPLSALAVNRAFTLAFLFLGYPCWCLVAAAAHAYRESSGAVDAAATAAAYRTQLLTPRDWFSLWRLNSRVAAWHSLCTRETDGGWHDYEMENKWAFLERGRARGVAVSPVLDVPSLCVKHKNEEGGMGIHFFKNALGGGDWIIQEVMANEPFVAGLLPPGAPLSTFRVMTASAGGLGAGAPLPPGSDRAVEAIACVFRAGRAGAATDHDSVLFDVDLASGEIGRGTTNVQWYRLGLGNAFPLGNVRWAPPPDTHEHPDTGRRVSGAVVPGFRDRVLRLAEDAHAKLLPRVPLAGWDVVLSKDHGACLLEANLSCNFFRGSFDEAKYVDFIHAYLRHCETITPI